MSSDIQRHKNIELSPGDHIHLVGIGGSGLSAIARVLHGQGFVVSGSDLEANDLTAELAAEGMTIYIGHHPGNWQGADAILASSAIPDGNSELSSAREVGLPILKRSDLLGYLMRDHYGIAVAGSHGKTTTTGMISQILLEAQLDPTIILGGVLPLLGSNGHAGSGRIFVVEADEYDEMFLGLLPRMAVITNVEYDHPDQYASTDEYRHAFAKFAQLVPDDGTLILYGDDDRVRNLAAQFEESGRTIDFYGLHAGSWRATDLRGNQLGGLDFLVQHDQDVLGVARLRVPGEHNVLNALAAIVAASRMGVEFDVMRKALANFEGIGRRFQVKAETGGVTIIDDYAHHPTEIRATLAAARQRYGKRRIWAVWQPHTYSRTKAFLKEFAAAFKDADWVIALDIFRSRERDTLGITTASVVEAMNHAHARYLGSISQATSFIMDRVKPDDVIITLSAGDGYLVGSDLIRELKHRYSGGASTNDAQKTSRILNDISENMIEG